MDRRKKKGNRKRKGRLKIEDEKKKRIGLNEEEVKLKSINFSIMRECFSTPTPNKSPYFLMYVKIKIKDVNV